MTTPSSIDLLDSYWAALLGCAAASFEQARTVVLQHGEAMSDYNGIFMFKRLQSCIVSVPEPFVVPVAAALGQLDPEDAFSGNTVKRLLGSTVDRVIGPAWRGYVDAARFKPAATLGACPLLADHRPALNALAAACDPEQWEHSAIASEAGVVFGCFADDHLVAAGILRSQGDESKDIGVITHPAYRGQGYGRAVVSAMSGHAFEYTQVVQYCTLLENQPSMRLARSLGYADYALTNALRLR